MSRPLVSVVIAAYNAASFLPETLETALGQSYPNREVIVVDDGSTDDTRARIERYRARVRYLRRAHGGLAAARNTGLRVAAGDYIALLDADDLWHPDKLATQVEVAGRHPESGLIACTGVEFEGERVLSAPLLGRELLRALDGAPEGEVTGHFHHALIRSSTISCPAQTLIPRRVVQSLGEFVDSGAQDYDYYLRIAQRYPITLHRSRGEAPLVRWRYRGDSMSGHGERRRFVWGLDMLNVLRAHRARCDTASRRVVRRRRATLARALAREAYVYGDRTDRRYALHVLGRLLAARPWPPTALPVVIALLTPLPLRRAVTRGLRGLGWSWS